MWIAPPQFYDLSRMCRFPSLQNLHSFSRQRASEGCEQWLPVRMVSDSCYISLLPGDEMYPEVGSCQMDVTLNTDQSLNELHQGCSALHRIVALDPYTAAAVITITPKYNHLLPFTRSSLRTGTSSQL